MEKHLNPDFLEAVTPDLFLPSISKWTSLGGVMMLTSMVTAIAISTVFRYKVTVKAPVQIRPEGELSIVQASRAGKVSQITAKVNQKIERGDIIAYLDDFRLQQERKELKNKISSTQQQLEKNRQQIKSKEEQIKIEKRQIRKNIDLLQAELNLTEINALNSQVSLIAESKKAETNFNLAKDKLARYQQLADLGAISQLQLFEAQATYNTEKAKLKKAKSQINPNPAKINIVKEKIAEGKTKEKQQLIVLEQEKQQLQQQQLQIIRQLESDRRELIKLNSELAQMTIRSSTSGTIQELNLRNKDRVLQEGDEIATIVPSDSNLVIKAIVAISDIEKVKLNQNVNIKVSSCPYTDYGVLKGKVIAISPDAIIADTINTVNNYYQVIVQPENLVLSNSQQQCKIKAGMNGRAEIVTQQETIFKFVLRKSRLLANL